MIRHSKMRSVQICSFFLNENCSAYKDPDHDWKVKFPDIPKPSKHPITPPKQNVPRLKVLQISDTHYDPYYLMGSNAECGEPVCCRVVDGSVASNATAAGKWGDYRKCDAPKILIENAFQHIINTHKVCFFFNYSKFLVKYSNYNVYILDNNQTKKKNVWVSEPMVEVKLLSL